MTERVNRERSGGTLCSVCLCLCLYVGGSACKAGTMKANPTQAKQLNRYCNHMPNGSGQLRRHSLHGGKHLPSNDSLATTCPLLLLAVVAGTNLNVTCLRPASLKWSDVQVTLTAAVAAAPCSLGFNQSTSFVIRAGPTVTAIGQPQPVCPAFTGRAILDFSMAPSPSGAQFTLTSSASGVTCTPVPPSINGEHMWSKRPATHADHFSE